MTLPENSQILEACIKQAGLMLCEAVTSKDYTLAHGLEALQRNLISMRTPETVRILEVARGLV